MKLLILDGTGFGSLAVVRSFICYIQHHEANLDKLTYDWECLGVTSGVVEIEKVVK